MCTCKLKSYTLTLEGYKEWEKNTVCVWACANSPNLWMSANILSCYCFDPAF